MVEALVAVLCKQTDRDGFIINQDILISYKHGQIVASKMKIVLVFEDFFCLSCPTGFRQEFPDLRVLKIDSLSSE